jgi:hypothetical protein
MDNLFAVQSDKDYQLDTLDQSDEDEEPTAPDLKKPQNGAAKKDSADDTHSART